MSSIYLPILIGYEAGVGLVNESDRLFIDNSGTSYPLIYGDFSSDALTFNGSTTTTGTSAFEDVVSIGGTTTAAGEIRLLEDLDDGSHYTAFKAQAQAADVTYTLPAADGTNGQALTTDGSGMLSWGSVATSLDGLSDAKVEGTDFTGSMILGHQATGILSAATDNTAVGIGAMDAITEGHYNTALGNSALGNVTSGAANTAVGVFALESLTTGNDNISMGIYSGSQITTGNKNISIGHEAGYGITTGSNNVAIGYGLFRDGCRGWSHRRHWLRECWYRLCRNV